MPWRQRMTGINSDWHDLRRPCCAACDRFRHVKARQLPGCQSSLSISLLCCDPIPVCHALGCWFPTCEASSAQSTDVTVHATQSSSFTWHCKHGHFTVLFYIFSIQHDSYQT